jgi:lysine 2,3-aminomutase
MALQKIEDNTSRAAGKKYAEMVRVRLGTRLPVYLPQRVTPQLVRILKDFREKAMKIGIQQFVIQTHFISALEITPEARSAVRGLLSAGWMVTNQEVFTAAASRRGHSAKLRKVLNDIGILPYYNFQVKGHGENRHNFTPIARSVQEQNEEKTLGKVPGALLPEIKKLTGHPENMVDHINHLRQRHGLPFLATDRNVMNIPGVGKSLTFRVVGLTNDGRRILEFVHDHTRNHSPIIERMEKVTIIESKSIARYLKQLERLGENPAEYHAIYGYSIGETEERMPIYEYPEYGFRITDELTNLQL